MSATTKMSERTENSKAEGHGKEEAADSFGAAKTIIEQELSKQGVAESDRQTVGESSHQSLAEGEIELDKLGGTDAERECEPVRSEMETDGCGEENTADKNVDGEHSSETQISESTVVSNSSHQAMHQSDKVVNTTGCDDQATVIDVTKNLNASGMEQSQSDGMCSADKCSNTTSDSLDDASADKHVNVEISRSQGNNVQESQQTFEENTILSTVADACNDDSERKTVRVSDDTNLIDDELKKDWSKKQVTDLETATDVGSMSDDSSNLTANTRDQPSLPDEERNITGLSNSDMLDKGEPDGDCLDNSSADGPCSMDVESPVKASESMLQDEHEAAVKGPLALEGNDSSGSPTSAFGITHRKICDLSVDDIQDKGESYQDCFEKTTEDGPCSMNVEVPVGASESVSQQESTAAIEGLLVLDGNESSGSPISSKDTTERGGSIEGRPGQQPEEAVEVHGDASGTKRKLSVEEPSSDMGRMPPDSPTQAKRQKVQATSLELRGLSVEDNTEQVEDYVPSQATSSAVEPRENLGEMDLVLQAELTGETLVNDCEMYPQNNINSEVILDASVVEKEQDHLLTEDIVTERFETRRKSEPESALMQSSVENSNFEEGKTMNEDQVNKDYSEITVPEVTPCSEQDISNSANEAENHGQSTPSKAVTNNSDDTTKTQNESNSSHLMPSRKIPCATVLPNSHLPKLNFTGSMKLDDGLQDINKSIGPEMEQWFLAATGKVLSHSLEISDIGEQVKISDQGEPKNVVSSANTSSMSTDSSQWTNATFDGAVVAEYKIKDKSGENKKESELNGDEKAIGHSPKQDSHTDKLMDKNLRSSIEGQSDIPMSEKQPAATCQSAQQINLLPTDNLSKHNVSPEKKMESHCNVKEALLKLKMSIKTTVKDLRSLKRNTGTPQSLDSAKQTPENTENKSADSAKQTPENTENKLADSAKQTPENTENKSTSAETKDNLSHQPEKDDTGTKENMVVEAHTSKNICPGDEITPDISSGGLNANGVDIANSEDANNSVVSATIDKDVMATEVEGGNTPLSRGNVGDDCTFITNNDNPGSPVEILSTAEFMDRVINAAYNRDGKKSLESNKFSKVNMATTLVNVDSAKNSDSDGRADATLADDVQKNTSLNAAGSRNGKVVNFSGITVDHIDKNKASGCNVASSNDKNESIKVYSDNKSRELIAANQGNGQQSELKQCDIIYVNQDDKAEAHGDTKASHSSDAVVLSASDSEPDDDVVILPDPPKQIVVISDDDDDDDDDNNYVQNNQDLDEGNKKDVLFSGQSSAFLRQKIIQNLMFRSDRSERVSSQDVNNPSPMPVSLHVNKTVQSQPPLGHVHLGYQTSLKERSPVASILKQSHSHKISKESSGSKNVTSAAERDKDKGIAKQAAPSAWKPKTALELLQFQRSLVQQQQPQKAKNLSDQSNSKNSCTPGTKELTVSVNGNLFNDETWDQLVGMVKKAAESQSLIGNRAELDSGGKGQQQNVQGSQYRLGKPVVIVNGKIIRGETWTDLKERVKEHVAMLTTQHNANKDTVTTVQQNTGSAAAAAAPTVSHQQQASKRMENAPVIPSTSPFGIFLPCGSVSTLSKAVTTSAQISTSGRTVGGQRIVPGQHSGSASTSSSSLNSHMQQLISLSRKLNSKSGVTTALGPELVNQAPVPTVINQHSLLTPESVNTPIVLPPLSVSAFSQGATLLLNSAPGASTILPVSSLLTPATQSAGGTKCQRSSDNNSTQSSGQKQPGNKQAQPKTTFVWTDDSDDGDDNDDDIETFEVGHTISGEILGPALKARDNEHANEATLQSIRFKLSSTRATAAAAAAVEPTKMSSHKEKRQRLMSNIDRCINRHKEDVASSGAEADKIEDKHISGVRDNHVGGFHDKQVSSVSKQVSEQISSIQPQQGSSDIGKQVSSVHVKQVPAVTDNLSQLVTNYISTKFKQIFSKNNPGSSSQQQNRLQEGSNSSDGEEGYDSEKEFIRRSKMKKKTCDATKSCYIVLEDIIDVINKGVIAEKDLFKVCKSSCRKGALKRKFNCTY